MKRFVLTTVSLAACSENLTPQPAVRDELPACVPDRDGAIEAHELPLALGVTAPYYEGKNRTFDSLGSGGVWDLSIEDPGDAVVARGPVALKDQWYASEFPLGDFVVPDAAGLDGIYHQDDQALWLDGIASRDQAPSMQTLVHYTLPVPVLRFPIVDGDAYETLAEIADGKTSGLPFVGTDRVRVEVVGEGRLDLPYVRFSPTLRVRTHVERVPSSGSPRVSRRSTSFLFECFGEVARAESVLDETDPDFTNAALLRRFALGARP